MTDFLGSLWDSVFTAGPTPNLVLATNASFAALQAILLALLLATYSVHFVILSILCGALWWAINWFVAELRIAEQLKRDREKREETPRPDDEKGRLKSNVLDTQAVQHTDDDAGDEEGATTETEAEDMGSRASLLGTSSKQHRASSSSARSALGGSGHLLPRPGSSAASEASGVHISGQSSSGDEVEIRKRGSELEMSSTTDSEWERISDAGRSEDI